MTPLLEKVKAHNERWYDCLMFAVHDVPIPDNSPAMDDYNHLNRFISNHLIKSEMVMGIDWTDFAFFCEEKGFGRIPLSVLYSALRKGDISSVDHNGIVVHIIDPHKVANVKILDDLL